MQWSDTALKVHVARLVEMEYLLVHRGRAGRYDYELLFDGNGGEYHLMGLIDVEKLTYDSNRSGQNINQSGAGQGLVRGQSGNEKAEQPLNHKALLESGLKDTKSTSLSEKNPAESIVEPETV